MRLRTKILYFILLVFLASGVLYGDMISYGVQQGIGQFKILYNAVPIEDLLKDPNYPEENKEKLRLIQEIREFSLNSLGLNDSESYKKLYDQEDKPILWVLTASKPFKLEEHKWHFPFLGSLGYKGFFSKSIAIEEEEELKSINLDTDLGAVNAWSTLGYFDDPILSNMLKKKPGGLSRLIIHELTHGTLYVKGEDAFNENLATFVGDNGAILFMKSKYGNESEELKKYLGALDDIVMYSDHMIRGTKRLDSLYKSFEMKDLSNEEKLEMKQKMIRSILGSSDTINFNSDDSYKHLLESNFTPNNTYFMTFKRYREQQNEFQEEFESQFNSDFPKYLAHLKEKYGK